MTSNELTTARPRKLLLSVINFSSDPHEEKSKTYIDALQFLADQDITAPVYQDRWGKIVSFTQREGYGNVYVGRVASFVPIKGDKPWHKDGQKEALDPSDVENKARALAGYGQDQRDFYFLFDPVSHRIVLQSKNHAGKSMSASSFQKLLTNLVSQKKFTERFPMEFQAKVEPREGVIEEMLSHDDITRLEIFIEAKPNPGDLEQTIDAKYKEELTAEGLDSLAVIKTSKIGLKASDETIATCNVAKSYGHVSVKRKGQTKVSTKKFPAEEHYTSYDNNPEGSLVESGKAYLKKLFPSFYRNGSSANNNPSQPGA